MGTATEETFLPMDNEISNIAELDECLKLAAIRSNPPKSIGVDLDGVIFETNWSEAVNLLFKKNIQLESIYCHNLQECLGLTPLQLHQLFTLVLYRDAPVVPKALEVLTELKDSYRILLVTERWRFVPKQITLAWLTRHEIPYDDICWLGELSDNLPYSVDYLIDDNITKALNLIGQVNKRVLLFNYPWNQGSLNINKLFVRIYGWLELQYLSDELFHEN